MKRTDIEKQLKKDLSATAPSDFNTVWSKCSPSGEVGEELIFEPVPATAHDGRASRKLSRRTISLSIAALAALICIAAVICCVTLLGGNGGFVQPFSVGYFVVDVNPSVQVNYGGDGVVTSAKGLNADGEALLNGIDLVGLTYDKAADAIFDACEARGYFSAERNDNAILTTATKENGEKDEKITAEINKRFTQKFEDKNLKGVVISDVDNTKWQKESEKYGINGQKYDFIMRYLEMGGKLDESEYATITIHELYSLISDLEKNSKDK